MRGALTVLFILLLGLLLGLPLGTPAFGAAAREGVNRIDELKERAVDLFNEREYKKAIPLLNEILSIDPEDKTASRYLLIFRRQVIEPYCKAAADAFMAGNYPEAITHWEEILRIDPDDNRVKALIEESFTSSDREVSGSMLDLANALLKEGKHMEAANELMKILEAYPANLQAQQILQSTRRTLNDSTMKDLYAKADAFFKQKEYDVAIEYWKMVLAIDETQELASRQIASVHKTKLNDIYSSARKLYRIGNYAGSRDKYNLILAENPTDKNVNKMIDRLNQIIKIVPQIKEKGKAWNILRRGLLHHVSINGNPMVAVAAGWYASQIDPGNPIIMAISEFIDREHISVIRNMETPVKDMNIIDQYLFAALNHIYEGRYDRAIQECSLVLDLEPNNVLALKRLGSAYYAMGRKSKARKTWKKALSLDPKDGELKEFIKQAQ